MVCETPDVTAKALASGLDSSGWMKHIKAVLDTSVFIAKVLYYVLCIHSYMYPLTLWQENSAHRTITKMAISGKGFKKGRHLVN